MPEQQDQDLHQKIDKAEQNKLVKLWLAFLEVMNTRWFWGGVFSISVIAFLSIWGLVAQVSKNIAGIQTSVDRLKEITDDLKTLPTNLTKVEAEVKGLSGKIDSQGGQITSIEGNLAKAEVRLGVLEIQISKIEPSFTKIDENRETDLKAMSKSNATVLQSLAAMSNEIKQQSTAMQLFYRELKASNKGPLDNSPKFSIPVAMIATMVKMDETGKYPAIITIPLGSINRNLVKKVQISPPTKEVFVSKDIFDPSGQLVLVLGTDFDPKKVEASRSFIEFFYE